MKRKASQAIKNIVKRARNHLGSHGGVYANAAGGYIGSKLQGGPQKADIASSALTTQNDTARAYIKKKKKQTKSGRKRVLRKKKFVANVKKAISTGQPLIHYNENSSVVVTVNNPFGSAWNTNPYQVWYAGGVSGGASFSNPKFTLFGGSVSTAGAVQTLDVSGYVQATAKLMQNRYNGTDVAPPTVDTIDIYVKYCKLEIAVQNTTSSTITVDLYEFVAAKDIGKGELKITPYDCMTQIKSETTLNTGYTAVVDQEQYGATPFDFANFGQIWTIKNKTTILLGAGQSTTFEAVGPRGMWRGSKMTNLTAMKGKTTMFALCFGSRVAFDLGAGISPAKVAFNKTYKLKYPAGTPTLVDGIEQNVVNQYI